MKRTLLRKSRRFVRDEDGSVAMEGAIVMSVMAIMLLAMVDFGFYISTKVELKQALRAGAQKALASQAMTDIETAVKAATTLDVTVASVSGDADTALSCYCDDGTSSDCDSPVSGCAATQPAGFAEFTASATFSPLFINIGFFTQDMTVTETASIRVQ